MICGKLSINKPLAGGANYEGVDFEGVAPEADEAGKTKVHPRNFGGIVSG